MRRALLFLLFTACGARSPLEGPLASADARMDSATADVVVDVVRPETPPAACDWTAGEMQRITNVRGGASLLSAVAGPDNSVWVGWQESLATPMEFPSYMLTAVTSEGRTIFQAPTLPRPRIITGFIGPAQIAYSEQLQQGAALGWDSENSCSMLLFDQRGTPTRPPFDPLQGSTDFPLQHCRNLRAASGRWDFLADQIRAIEGISMVQRDRNGAIVNTANLLTISINGPNLTRASSADGSFLLAWYSTIDTPMRPVALQRFSADGQPQGDERQLLDPPLAIQRLRMIDTPAGILAAWEWNRGSTGTNISHRWIQRTGEARTPVQSVTVGPTYAGALSITYANEALVLHATNDRRLRLTALREDGNIRRSFDIAIGATRYADTRMVPLSDGVLVVFEGVLSNESSQIYALPLRCLTTM